MVKQIEATRYLITGVYPSKAFIKEWITSALQIEKGDYIYLDGGKTKVHVVKIWQTKPAIMDINI